MNYISIIIIKVLKKKKSNLPLNRRWDRMLVPKQVKTRWCGKKHQLK